MTKLDFYISVHLEANDWYTSGTVGSQGAPDQKVEQIWSLLEFHFRAVYYMPKCFFFLGSHLILGLLCFKQKCRPPKYLVPKFWLRPYVKSLICRDRPLRWLILNHCPVLVLGNKITCLGHLNFICYFCGSQPGIRTHNVLIVRLIRHHFALQLSIY